MSNNEANEERNDAYTFAARLPVNVPLSEVSAVSYRVAVKMRDAAMAEYVTPYTWKVEYDDDTRILQITLVRMIDVVDRYLNG